MFAENGKRLDDSDPAQLRENFVGCSYSIKMKQLVHDEPSCSIEPVCKSLSSKNKDWGWMLERRTVSGSAASFSAMPKKCTAKLMRIMIFF